MKVDFISFSKKPDAFIDDPSFRYRCQNLAIALIQNNIQCSLQHIESFAPSKETTHVVFHRPRYSYSFHRLIKKLRSNNITVIADFDDLVFDVDYVEFSPAILNNILPRNKVSKHYKSHFQALNYFDHVNVSTESLARHVSKLLPSAKVSIIHNTIHHDWIHTSSRKTQKRKVLTYFPGTRSHDRDFWQIEDTIKTFLDKTPSVHLLIIGPLSSNLLNQPNRQINHIQRLPFKDYIHAASNSWVNLLPLESTPFNQCKSAIKVIEAAKYKAPTICSPLPDAQRFENIGSFTAINQEQWLNTLERFLDYDLYQHTTKQLEQKFPLKTNPQIMASQFYKNYALNFSAKE